MLSPPNLSPTTVTTFTSVLQFVGGRSVDAVLWSLEPAAAEYVCCLISRQPFLAQQLPVATDGKLRHNYSTSVRWHLSSRHSVWLWHYRRTVGPSVCPEMKKSR